MDAAAAAMIGDPVGPPEAVPAVADRAARVDGALDPAARLGALFDRFQPRLTTLARRMVFDTEDALDLVQETFFRAARAPRAVPADDRSAEAWLVRALVNLAHDRGRRKSVRARAAARIERERRVRHAVHDPASPVIARASVAAALAALSTRQRAIVVMHHFEEREVEEIARLLGIGRVTVRWHLAAAHRVLRGVLARVGREDAP